MERKTMTKQDLRSGMRMKLRDGQVVIVMTGTEMGTVFWGKNNWGPVSTSFTEDLKSKYYSSHDVMEVYEYRDNRTILNLNELGPRLWKRDENQKKIDEQEKLINDAKANIKAEKEKIQKAKQRVYDLRNS